MNDNFKLSFIILSLMFTVTADRYDGECKFSLMPEVSNNIETGEIYKEDRTIKDDGKIKCLKIHLTISDCTITKSKPGEILEIWTVDKGWTETRYFPVREDFDEKKTGLIIVETSDPTQLKIVDGKIQFKEGENKSIAPTKFFFLETNPNREFNERMKNIIEAQRKKTGNPWCADTYPEAENDSLNKSVKLLLKWVSSPSPISENQIHSQFKKNVEIKKSAAKEILV